MTKIPTRKTKQNQNTVTHSRYKNIRLHNDNEPTQDSQLEQQQSPK